jgi:hypothetical protein
LEWQASRVELEFGVESRNSAEFSQTHDAIVHDSSNDKIKTSCLAETEADDPLEYMWVQFDQERFSNTKLLSIAKDKCGLASKQVGREGTPAGAAVEQSG